MKNFYHIIIYSILLFSLPLKAGEGLVYYNNRQDSITNNKKYRNHGNWSDELAEKLGALKITPLNKKIQTFKNLIGIAPQNYIDYSYIEATFGYFIKNVPYDTITLIKNDFFEDRIRDQEFFKTYPKAEAEFAEILNGGMRNGTLEKMSRRDMWDRELRIYKNYMPANLFPDVKKAIYELHDSLKMSWNDTVYVLKGRETALARLIKSHILNQDSILRNKLQIEFFQQYSNDITNNLTWEGQLKYAIDFGKQQEGETCPIKLKGFKKKGYIKNDKEKRKLIEKMFSASSCIALKNGMGRTDYGIYNIEHILATLPERERCTEQFSYLKKRLAEKIQPGMRLLQLEWEYDKQTFYTTAIVSNTANKIIYDNVGTIAAFEIKEYNEWDFAPRLHMATPEELDTTDIEFRVVQPRPFARSFIEYNMLGGVKYSYAVYCGAHFDEGGILSDFQTQQRSYSDDFHDCKTDIRTIEGEKGISPIYKFFYIMGYGRMPVSITWSGEGAQTSTDVHCDKGECTLKPQWW